MSETEIENFDYSSGIPRPHHSLYFEDGSLVIQVENAIFKVHRSLLAKQSSVIEDMLKAPHKSGSVDGTDTRPLILTGDSAYGWELLLDSHYDSSQFWINWAGLNVRMLAILPIAHKYCMTKTEEAIVTMLKKTATTNGYVDLMAAAQIVDSKPLYNEALAGLRQVGQKLDREQAMRIGFNAYFDVMDGFPSRCKFCNYAAPIGCQNCGRSQC